MNDEFIGMGEAARRLQVAEARVAREILKRAGVDLVLISARAYVVRAADVDRLAQERGGKVSPGRPRKVEGEPVAS